MVVWYGWNVLVITTLLFYLLDVIRAYKSLAKEKEALERSVKVLSHRHHERQLPTPTTEEASNQEILQDTEDQIDGDVEKSEENTSTIERANKVMPSRYYQTMQQQIA